MEISERDGALALLKEGAVTGECRFSVCGAATTVEAFCIDPAWRRRGYGTYLLKELLRRGGGFTRGQASTFTAPLPADPAELAFWAKQGFAPKGDRLVRRRVPDLSAVSVAHEVLAAKLASPRLLIDATCGNGGDTAFFCSLAAKSGGHVLAMDIQPEAIASTRAHLAAEGYDAALTTLVCDSHTNLAAYAVPGSADAILFNFGWLPGAEHNVFSTADSSLPALAAALDTLCPGGVLCAVLYSGKLIGRDEKQAVLAWLRALPLTKYTVLVCEFGNWADTAPLPCFVFKKEV